MTVTHYRHPVFGYHACGMGGRNPKLSDDLKGVTCKRCLQTVTGKKALVRTHKRFSASKELLDWLEAQPNQNEIIRSALEEYRAKHG
jgi:hypothetical protein